MNIVNAGLEGTTVHAIDILINIWTIFLYHEVRHKDIKMGWLFSYWAAECSLRNQVRKTGLSSAA